MATRRIAIAALVLAIGATHARANPALDRARTAIDASDYLGAKTALTEALAAGDAHPDELVEIYRLSGTIAAGLGDTNAAVAAFERALALSPKLALPAGTSPKITRPFATAQAFFKTHEPLGVKVDTASTPPSATVAIGSDPLAMIAGARAIVRVDGGAEQTIDGSIQNNAIALPLPAGHRIDVRVIVRDEHGNHLAEVGSADVPLVIVGSAPEPVVAKPHVVAHAPAAPPPAPGHARPLYLKWWLWGGAAVALAGVGTAYGIGTYQAQNDLKSLDGPTHGIADAQAIQSRGQRDALIANLALGSAGALAIGAAILYLTDHHGTEVAPAPLPGGGAVVVEGKF